MRAPQTKPSGSTRGHKEGATRGKERKPFSDYAKKEKSTGLTTSEAICAKGGNPQEWKGIPPANPGGPRRDRTSGGKEGPFPIRTWSLCKESPVGRNCCAGRSCRTQPTIGNGRLGQADDGVRLEDLNNPDRVEGALLALRIRGGGDGEGPGKALPKNQGREIRPREMGERERIMRTGLASSMHQCVVRAANKVLTRCSTQVRWTRGPRLPHDPLGRGPRPSWGYA